MAYFSNGTEGMDYCAQWCDRCVHRNGSDGKSGCPIWLAHLLYAYEECNSKSNAKAMLDILIPMVPSGAGYDVAGECSMFKKGEAVPEPYPDVLYGGQPKPAVMPAMQEWAKERGLIKT